MATAFEELYNHLKPTIDLLLDKGFGVETFHEPQRGYGFIANCENYIIRVFIYFDESEECGKYLVFQERKDHYLSGGRILKQLDLYKANEVYDSILAMVEERSV